MQIHITETQAEKIAERRLMLALRTDKRYAHAGSAVAQTNAEDTIGAEIWATIERSYVIVPVQ